MNKKMKIFLIVIFVGLVLGISAVFILNKNLNTNRDKETLVKKEGKTTNKNTDEFSKNGAVKATTDALKELQKTPSPDLTLEERAKKVSSLNYDKKSVFTNSGWSKLRLQDFMKDDPRGAALTAQSILSVINLIETSGNKEINATPIDYSGAVYFDSDAKIAYVPVDLYTNSSTNLTFEMVYIDGKWTMQTYSLISQIAIKNTNSEKK